MSRNDRFWVNGPRSKSSHNVPVAGVGYRNHPFPSRSDACMHAGLSQKAGWKTWLCRPQRPSGRRCMPSRRSLSPLASPPALSFRIYCSTAIFRQPFQEIDDRIIHPGVRDEIAMAAVATRDDCNAA